MDEHKTTTIDQTEPTSLAGSDASGGRRRSTLVLAGGTLTAVLTVGLFAVAHADRAADTPPGSGAGTVPVGAAAGGTSGQTYREQVPPFSPTAATTPNQQGQTYREQVPHGS